MFPVLLAFSAAIAFGIADFVGGVASRKVDALRVVLVAYPVSALFAAGAALSVGIAPSVVSLAWGAAFGGFEAVAVWLFYLALASGPMSIVSPLASLLVAGIPLITGLALGERPGMFALIGIGLAVAAVALFSWDPESHGSAKGLSERRRFTTRTAFLTVGAGTAYALGFVFLSRVPSGTGLWPIVAAGLVATVIVTIAAATTGNLTIPADFPFSLVIGIGALDVAANVAMMYAFQGSMLSLVSVVGSLDPVATVVLAMVVLGERLGWRQGVGLAFTCAALSLVAIA